MFNVLAAIELLILVQGTAPAPPPPVDKLHEALNVAAAKRASTLRMEAGGCVKDEPRVCALMNDCRVTCRYRIAPNVSIEAKADQPSGPLKRISAKVPGGRESAERMVRAAGALAVALIRNLSNTDIDKLMEKLGGKSSDVFDDGERTAELDLFEYRYETGRKGTTLDIKSLAGTCIVGKTC